jgi:DNA polymerase-3 subunit delta
MPSLSAQQLAARLARRQPIPGLLLLGGDFYLRDQCRAQLLEAFIPEASRAWAVSRFSLEDVSLDRVLRQAQTLPMLAPRQVVFVSDLEAFLRLGDKAQESLLASLEDYLERPAPFTVLVFEAAELDQRTRLARLLSDKTLVVSVELAEGKGDDKREATVNASVALIPSLAAEMGARIDSDACRELAEAANGNLAQIRNELAKLALFMEKGEPITVEAVDALVVSGQKSSVFRMADMLAARQPGPALEFLDRLLREGEQAPALVGGMAWMYRKLLEAQEAPRGMNRFAAAGTLKMRPDTAEMALACAQQIPRQRLLDGLVALYNADAQLKGGAREPRAVLEFLIVRLTA